MVLAIDLTPHQQAFLQDRATAAGLSIEEYARQALLGPAIEAAPPATPAEALEYWRRIGVPGVFAGRSDAPQLARELRQEAEQRSQ